jgi:hypothetical protein
MKKILMLMPNFQQINIFLKHLLLDRHLAVTKLRHAAPPLGLKHSVLEGNFLQVLVCIKNLTEITNFLATFLGNVKFNLK